MKKTTKAVLFSLLLLPGSGHMVLRCWWRGCAIAAPILVTAGFLLTYSTNRAMLALDKVLNGEISPDVASIEQYLRESQSSTAALLVSLATYGILLIWILAAADAYRLARKSVASELQD